MVPECDEVLALDVVHCTCLECRLGTRVQKRFSDLVLDLFLPPMPSCLFCQSVGRLQVSSMLCLYVV